MQTTSSSQKSPTRAAAGAGIVFISQVLGYGLYFLAQRLILSSISKDDYGALSYIQLMCSLLMVVLVDAGMNNVVLREMIARPEEKRQIMSTVVWLRLGATLLTAGLVTVFCIVTGAAPIATAMLAVAMISLSSRSSMIRSSLELPFREQLNFVRISASFIFDWLLYLVLLYSFRSKLEPTTIFGLQIIASLPATLYLAWKVQLLKLLFPLPSFSFVKRLVREIIPQTSQLILQNVHAALDLSILKAFASSSIEIGIVNAVANMGQIILTAFIALSSTLFPMIADAIQLGKENAHYRIERSLSVVTFVAALLATCLCTLSPFIAYVFTKNVYADNLLQFQLQFWLSVLTCVAQMTLLVNSAQNEHRAVFFSGLFMVIGSMSADFILIPMHLSTGYILAKCWSNALSAGVSLWFIARYTGSALVLKFVLRSTVLIAVCVPYSLFILRYSTQLPALLGALILCFGTAAAIGLVTKDELRLMQKMREKISARLNFRNSAQA